MTVLIFFLMDFMVAPLCAQTYPSKPVRFILPFPAGGLTDVLGRIMGQKFADGLGQPIVPENRPGAGGNLGIEVAAKARPDGYTIVLSGPAIALFLAEAGADVALTGRSLPELEKTAEEIRKLGQKALAIAMDVTDFSQIEAAIQKIISEFGRIDILVNNAATRSHKPLIEMSEKEWRSVIDTNLTGAFLCCKAVGPYMISQGGGRVINISSRAGIRGRANVTAYCSSKGGLNQLTQALALEWAPYNILVNAVAPGIINTDRSYNGSTAIPSIPEARVAGIPLKRAAELGEILPLVLYFATEACSYTTGQIVLIDGGCSAQ